MSASAHALVIVVQPEDARILEEDLAGQPARQHLLEALAAVDPDSGVACGTDAELRDGQGILIIDARASFSRVALSAAFDRIRSNCGVWQVLDSGKTLLVYLPPLHRRTGPFRRQRTMPGQGLESALDPDAIVGAIRIESGDLDPAATARLICTFEDLAGVEMRILLERAVRAMRQGVRVRDPHSLYIRGELVCDASVEIDVDVIIEGRVELGAGSYVGAHSILRNARVGRATRIHPYSLVEQSSVGADGFVGPYGRIRPGCEIGDRVQIGNYVEIKNSRIGNGGRINHHTFIGDAVLAEEVTVGAGTITCNHDGTGTNQTIIERGAYIGSGCNLVAPLTIGERAVVGAGSTVTRDVPAAKLTLARSPQTTIDNWRGPKNRRDGR